MLELISARGSKSAQVIVKWTVLALMMEAKKIRLYFAHQNGPILGLKQIFYIYGVELQIMKVHGTAVAMKLEIVARSRHYTRIRPKIMFRCRMIQEYSFLKGLNYFATA